LTCSLPAWIVQHIWSFRWYTSDNIQGALKEGDVIPIMAKQ
jgi:hypothetical protein